jgi:hypothetical protein
MAAIEVLALVVAIGLGLAALLAVVIVGVRQEEKAWSLGQAAPSMPARLARRILGATFPVSRLAEPAALEEIAAGGRDDLFSGTFAGR